MSTRQAFDLPTHEELSRLASVDPAAFEALRREMIENLISSAPERSKSRLKGIQFRVDCVRRLSQRQWRWYASTVPAVGWTASGIYHGAVDELPC